MSTGDKLGPLESAFFNSHDAGVQALGAAGERVTAAAVDITEAARVIAASGVSSKEEAVESERLKGRVAKLEDDVATLKTGLQAIKADGTISKWALVGFVVLPILGTALGAGVMWLVSLKGG